jgi:hypothetical protein
MKKGDWVMNKADTEYKPIGFVLRVSQKNKWADVRWSIQGRELIKRMPMNDLVVVTTISVSMLGVKSSQS